MNRRARQAWSILLIAIGGAVRAEGLEEVTISAQKREQSLLATGLTVSVIDADSIAALQLRQADDIAALEPNLSINKPFGNANPVLVMRGVGLQDFNVNNAPNIGVYVDETYLPSNALADFATFDLLQVEILKGPQSALWGRNATGGAVSYRTRRPEPERAGSLTARLASPEGWGLEGWLNLPVSESTALRLAAVSDRRNAAPFSSRTLQDRFGEFERHAMRLSVATAPTDTLSIDARLEFGRYSGDAYAITHVGIVGPRCPIGLSPPGAGLGDETRCFNTTTGYSDPDGDPDRGDWNILPRADRNMRIAAVRLRWQLGAGTLTALSSSARLDYERGEDTDASPLPLLQIAYRSDIRSLAQELRWSATSRSGAVWLLGAQVSRDTHEEARTATLAGLFPGLLNDASLDYDQKVRTAAVFAQTEWPLSDRLRMTAAARYTRDSLVFVGGARAGPGEFVPAFVAAVFPGLPAIVSVRRRYEDVSGRVAVDLRLAEELLLYASLSRGYKPGGVFGGFGLTVDAFSPYQQESLYALEAGSKWRSRKRSLEITAAVFAYDYRDVQGQKLVQASTGSLPVLSNVGDARVLGIESTASWKPAAAWQMQLAAGWLDTSLREDLPTLDSLQRPLSLRGRELPHAPRWSLRAVARYAPTRTERSWQPSLALDATFRARYFNDLPNQEHLAQRSSIVLLGASAQLASLDGTLMLELWGRNLLDERYRLHGNSSGIGNDLLMYSEGRNYGLSVTRRWR